MDALEVMLRKVSYRKGLELYKKLCAGDDDKDFKRCVEILFSDDFKDCLLYTSPSPRDLSTSRMPSSA